MDDKPDDPNGETLQDKRRRKPRNEKATRHELYFDKTWDRVELDELMAAHRRLQGSR